jgi:gliding motility-associated-like protein
MKRYLLFILFSLVFLPVFAKHVTGGEIIYKYLGPGGAAGSKQYEITLRLFRDDNTIGGAALPASLAIAVYNNDNNQNISGYINVAQASTETLPILAAPNCLTNAPNLTYSAGYYTFTFELPANTQGYTISYQTCCRIDGIENTGNSVGATYVGEIPGNFTLPAGFDNSARFQTGISIICYNKPFILDFSATDTDGDSLVYSMTAAYDGGAATSAAFNTPAGPPFASISYSAPYYAQFPMGLTSNINTATGIISGIAPATAGRYVVAVLVKSFRNGVFIADHRKDFIITVADCDFASSELKPVYTSCDIADNFTVQFQNLNNSPLNLTFYWDFGDGTTSTAQAPSHQYAAAGDYILKLVVNRGAECADSTTAIVKVYPGFFPKFDSIPPVCVNLPVNFNDATTANYGTVNYWHWDFGEPTATNDTSRIRNPVYTYSNIGIKNVSLIVGTSKGCIDTVYRDVQIVDKPDLKLTNDTLICIIDTLQLHAVTSFTGGTIAWTPNFVIDDVTSFNPLVSPDVPTRYTAVYTYTPGCTATASTFVNVVSSTLLTAAADTTICRTDSVILRLNTNALYFKWTSSPQSGINDSTIKNPTVYPTAPLTRFHIRASISNKCFNDDDINVKTVPYPVAIAQAQDSICFGKSSQLQASGGSSYTWTPTNFLNNPNIANPISQAPKFSLTYTVKVSDTLGCPKPVSASVRVNVIKVKADAGSSDTSVVLGQPLQLNATGGNFYEWTPDTWLDNSQIFNPVSNPQNNITYSVKVSNKIGCFDIDTIKVKVFFLPPDLYVPSAFTPSSDNLNDVFRPIALGIKSLQGFKIFNRWGELIYATKDIGAGWDGKFKGQSQNAGTYVWEIDATDYKNVRIRKKGSVILIR